MVTEIPYLFFSKYCMSPTFYPSSNNTIEKTLKSSHFAATKENSPFREVVLLFVLEKGETESFAKIFKMKQVPVARC